MLDNFILPEYDDIISYDLSFGDDEYLDILFWMDGTDEELEIDIMNSCQNILRYYSLSDVKVRYRFTVDGDNFYSY